MLDLVDVGLSVGSKPILHDLNLHVLPGEIHAILGGNGCGKSTLASVIMGLSGFSPTSGKVIFWGEEITALPISDRADRASSLCDGTILKTGDPLAIGRFFQNHCRECPHGSAPPGEVLLHE